MKNITKHNRPINTVLKEYIERQQGGRHQFVCHLVFLLKRVKKKSVSKNHLDKVLLRNCHPDRP